MDVNDVKTLIEVFEMSSINKLTLLIDDTELTLERESTSQKIDEQSPAKISAPEMDEQMEVKTLGVTVQAPLVGVFYQANSPDHAPFVTIGSGVKKGDTLCIIEAMKVLNEIKAPVDGKVVAIHVNNGDVVDYNQILIEIGES